MTPSLPSKPDQIDADWLTDAMSARHPGIRVAAVDVTEVHEVTNTHVRLHLRYDEPAGAPDRMFAKLPPLDPARRELIARTGMGPREARFYTELAPELSFRVPEVSVALHDDEGSFFLLMEDLVRSGCTVSDGTRGVAPDSAARALEELAELHLRFEHADRRRTEVPWIPGANPDSTYGAVLLQQGLDHHRHRLSDDFAALSELYIAQSEALQALWHRAPLTVIHGDPHIGNLFDDHGRTGFLDWGIVNVGSPMRDVSYFMTMAMAVEDRRSHERDLLRHYLDVRRAAGGTHIGFDEAWLEHRLHAAYTVPACCQIVAFPEGISERRRIFSEAFLARAEAAVADLEALAAVRAAGVG